MGYLVFKKVYIMFTSYRNKKILKTTNKIRILIILTNIDKSFLPEQTSSRQSNVENLLPLYIIQNNFGKYTVPLYFYAFSV